MNRKAYIQILIIALVILLIAIFTPLIGGMLLSYIQFVLKPIAEKSGYDNWLIHVFLTIPLLLVLVRQQWVNKYKRWKFYLLSTVISLLIYLQLTPLALAYMLKSSAFRTAYLITTFIVILVNGLFWVRKRKGGTLIEY